jgi:hypothetical protein
MRVAIALALSPLLMLQARPAAAQDPAAAGSMSEFPPPGMPPPAPPPAAQELSRRPVELVPEAGLVFPVCASGSESSDRCEGVEGGAIFGFSAFWRVTPRLAWGGGLTIAGFGYDPPERLGYQKTQGGAAWIGLLGRVYLFDEGSLDPYFQLGLGGAALGTTASIPGGDSYEQTGAGPAIQLGVGFDFILSRAIKFGPSLTYTHVFVDKIRRCRTGTSGECSDFAKGTDGHLNALLGLTARLTIMVGDEF